MRLSFAPSQLLAAFLMLIGLNVGSAQASTAIPPGTDAGMLAFEPATVTIKAGHRQIRQQQTGSHNAVFDGHDEYSHSDLAFAPGESWRTSGGRHFDYYCEPHQEPVWSAR